MALLQGTNVKKIQSDINMECIKKNFMSSVLPDKLILPIVCYNLY